VITFDHIISVIYAQKELNFIPGDEYVYSNSNYNLLVQILEKITGEQFDIWTREHIFKPLGMSDTHFHINHQRLVPRKVDSYTRGPVGYLNIDNNLCAVGSSSLFTTIDDLSKWMINFGSQEIGGPEVIKMMTTPSLLNNGEPNNYGFGLGIGAYKGLDLWQHSGGWAGFRTFVTYFPEKDFGLIVLSNDASFDPGGKTFELAELYLKDDLIEVDQVPGNQDTSDFDPAKVELSAYTGLFESEELHVAYTIELEDQALKIRHPRNFSFSLNPAKKDVFNVVGMGAEIKFERDEQGVLTGFRLSMMPRTRNILFLLSH